MGSPHPDQNYRHANFDRKLPQKTQTTESFFYSITIIIFNGKLSTRSLGTFLRISFRRSSSRDG